MKQLIIIATLMILTACGPIMEYRSNLILPQDENARKAINTCTSVHTNCKGLARNLRQNCMIFQSQQDHQYWEMCKDATNKHEDYCRAFWFKRFLPQNCPAAEQQLRDCMADYEQCVKNNGGRIEYYQCCVSNCAEAGLLHCNYIK